VGLSSVDATAEGAAPARPDLAAWLDATGEFLGAVNRGVPFDDLLNLVAGTVAQLTAYDYSSVLMPDEAGEKLLIRGFYGLRPSYVAEVNASRAPLIRPGELAEGPSSRAFRSQRPVALADIRADVTCEEWEVMAAEQGYRSILSLPLLASEGCIGVLTCYTRNCRVFGSDEVVLMETIANQAALAIESTRLRERQLARITALEQRVEHLQEEHRITQRAEDVHRDLMRLLLAGESLEHITRRLAEAIRADVLVKDAAGHQLGAAVVEAIDRSPGPDDDRPSLVAPVVLDDELAGRVWAFKSAGGFGAFERRALERGAMVVALAVSKLRTAQEVEWRLSREFLDDLLAVDGRSDPDSTLTRAHQLGLELSAPYALIVVRPDPDGEDSAARLPGNAARLQRTLLTQVQRVVNATGVGNAALVAARGEDVIVLWPASHGQPVAAELAESLRSQIRPYVGTVSVGLGPACSAVPDYGDAYRLAAGAVDLVQRDGQRDRVVALGDLGIYRLLLLVKRPEELIDFMRSVLQPLYEYDGRRDTTLVETLRAFLACGFSAAATAEALIVHPNTISYRLRRIEELLGINCHDPEALLQFQFAFLIERVLGEPSS
jgi:DNA-binding PucR family transcriptional regulator